MVKEKKYYNLIHRESEQLFLNDKTVTFKEAKELLNFLKATTPNGKQWSITEVTKDNFVMVREAKR